ncbi:hypothetical protein SYNTR_0034 [Candidatus Syntrophocurvum alkaliphilum]|uniref:Methyltransferase type 11 domain-containing protein n=1 Tax=Candidatus Syntrophocurvum alkaliphilum TaxID=2293317 RepID=A0A6I6D7J7_9FIRM|nr:methyltransferase domain-containing protein [Candidatus Syntrophocurvum alkaliphilum]QGT98627.1 hypothetical protein SYNTR_0034 [Candidatus Syntrophocurvum alkaliphilum]
MFRQKGYRGIGMEGFIAKFYNKTAQKSSDDYKNHALEISKYVNEGDLILEVAPGPGYSAIELAKLGNYNITGIDISKSLLELAKDNIKNEGQNINFILGDAAYMPFEDNTFDLIYCRAAFKNFSEPVKSLNEMYRVLKPRKNVIINDLSKDITNHYIDKHINSMNLNIIDTFITKVIFKKMLRRRAYTKKQFENFIKKSSFSKHEIIEKQLDYDIWLEK